MREIKDEIKRQLSSYVRQNQERLQLEEQLMRVRATMTAPKVQALDGMPHGSGGGGHTLADVVEAYMALEDRYLAKLKSLADTLTAVEDMIENLDPVERKLARCRYIDGKGWEEVCVAMSYSWRQTHRIHSRMLDKLAAAELEKRKEADADA